MSSNGNAGAVANNHSHNPSHPHPHSHSHPHPHHPNGIPVGKHGSGPEASLSSKVHHPAIGAAPGAVASPVAAAAAAAAALGGPHGHHVEGRKPKLRRFNSHDTGANMFSVADFENARLARRNEIEMKQRLQRRMKLSAAAGGAAGVGGLGVGSGGYGSGCGSGYGSAGGLGGGYGSLGGDCSTGDSKGSKHSNDSQTEPLPAEIFLDRYTLPRVVRISYKTKFSHETLQSSSSNGSTTTSTQSSSGTGTSSTSSSSGNVNGSTNNNSNHHHHHNSSSSSNNNNNNSGSQQSSSKHGSNSTPSTATTTVVTTTTNGADHQQQQQQSGELFLLYRLVRQRHIYHGFNAKTGVANRKKGVMIPQEFPGYFSLLNEKGLPTATLYTSLIQLVRERVYKFVSVDNMPAFTESQPAGAHHASPADVGGCLPLGGAGGGVGAYHAAGPTPAPQRPQYVKTTARGGQVFRLLAVFEDGKQDHSGGGGGAGMGCTGGGGAGSGVIGGGGGASGGGGKQHSHGREKEKGRYAQLLNENRQVLYVSLSTKGKFYEIEPGIPQILQKLGGGLGIGAGVDHHKKVNPDCVHRITALVTPQKELPMALRFISGPAGSSNSIPEQLTITKISTENVVIACPIEDVEVQSPLHLRKLHLTAEMNLVKCSLGFENEQRMFANPNVQNILKFCQFNCDQFLKMVEVEVLHRPERSGSKSRGDGLRILKPLHLPKLLRREKTTISAHEKEDSIIFLSKNDLANLEAKEEASRQSGQEGSAVTTTNRISEKMKVFQTTKKKWFRRQDKHAVTSLTSLDLDVQAKRMSMERYNDMSKLLQERFGDKHNSNDGGQTSSNGHHANSTGGHSNGSGSGNCEESVSSERSTSEIGCSDTETTTLHTIEEKLKKFNKSSHSMQPLLQKSLSLQDVELIGGGKPDLLASHHTNNNTNTNNTTADTISEAGTDLEDLENRPPSSSDGLHPSEHEQHQQQSFITEKLYTEFHVKTRQYSKSSSSLHQLLHFAVPQKLQSTGHESKRSLAQLKQQQQHQHQHHQQQQQHMASKKPLEFNIGEPVTGRRAAGGLSQFAAAAHGGGVGGVGGGSLSTSGHSQNTSLISPLTPSSLIEDDLPYSSVRDSLVLSSDESASEQPTGQICQALHLIDYTKENIYAEICHDAVAMGGIPSSQTRDTFSSNTHSTDIGDGYDDDYGDYASLTHPYMTVGGGGHCTSTAIATTTTTTGLSAAGTSSTSNGFSGGGQAVSRVQINCSSSPVSYHTVFLGDEPLGAHYAAGSAGKRESSASASASRSQRSSIGGAGQHDMANVTTVECYSGVARAEGGTTSMEAGGGSRAGGGARGAGGVVVVEENEEGVDNIYNTLK